MGKPGFFRSWRASIFLCICLVAMALHIAVDSVGDFTPVQLSFQCNCLVELSNHIHAHEDDFIALPIILRAVLGLAAADLAAPYLKSFSPMASPLLPPPRSL